MTVVFWGGKEEGKNINTISDEAERIIKGDVLSCYQIVRCYHSLTGPWISSRYGPRHNESLEHRKLNFIVYFWWCYTVHMYGA